jgi:phthalate 4,5-cis-dihydrodiol dehydrogenase
LNHQPIRVGVVGLGRAFTLMLPAFTRDPRVQLVAACDPREDARAAFTREFIRPAYEAVADLVTQRDVELVYIASPHELHAHHTELAARAGKHVLVEKPMAISREECARMVAACAHANVMLLVGHSHRFDTPILQARAQVASGGLGRVRMVQSLNYTDFLYRPRRAAELDTRVGGGVIFSQAAHQIDIVRSLIGSPLQRVRACTGNWDPQRDTEGAYSALLWFVCGATATLTYSGYGTFNSDVWCDDISELGSASASARDAFANTHARFANLQNDEDAAKNARGFGGSAAAQSTNVVAHEHFGPLIISCERGGLRVTPKGVWTYTKAGADFSPLGAPRIARQEVIDEVFSVLREGKKNTEDGRWSAVTVAACEALLQSAQTNADVVL